MGSHSLWVTWLGEGYLSAGRQDAAIRVAGRALDLARAHRERGHEAWALRLIAEIAFRGEPGDTAAAEDGYRRALRLAEELAMRPLAAHCHLGLGRLQRRMNQGTDARGHLDMAAGLLRDLDMGRWLAEAEAESAAS
jgi:tetratricopeptide (TPR) repeat protein